MPSRLERRPDAGTMPATTRTSKIADAGGPNVPYPLHVIREFLAGDLLAAVACGGRVLVGVEEGVLEQLDVRGLHRLEDLSSLTH